MLGKGPNVDMLKEPSQLPPPLFGQNELQPDVRVKEVKCGMSHFAAVTGRHSSLSSLDNEYCTTAYKRPIPNNVLHSMSCNKKHLKLMEGQ